MLLRLNVSKFFDFFDTFLFHVEIPANFRHVKTDRALSTVKYDYS